MKPLLYIICALFPLISGLAAAGEPAAKDAPADVLYSELMRPAALDKFADKRVRFDALYFNIAASNRGLEAKYQDRTRLIFCLGMVETNVCEMVFANALTDKTLRPLLERLNSGDQIRVTGTVRKHKPGPVRDDRKLEPPQEAADRLDNAIPLSTRHDINKEKLPDSLKNNPKAGIPANKLGGHKNTVEDEAAGSWENFVIEVETLEQVK